MSNAVIDGYALLIKENRIKASAVPARHREAVEASIAKLTPLEKDEKPKAAKKARKAKKEGA